MRSHLTFLFSACLQYIRLHILKERSYCVPGLVPEFVHFGVLGRRHISEDAGLNQEFDDSLDVVLGADHQAVEVCGVAFLCIVQKHSQKVQPEESEEAEGGVTTTLGGVEADCRNVVDEDITQVVHCDDGHLLQAIAGVSIVV